MKNDRIPPNPHPVKPPANLPPPRKESLQSENARLKAEVERLTKRNKFLEQIDSYLQGANEHSFEQRCDELEAEVERLRKAGDAVSLCLEAFWKGKPYDTSTNIECFDAWRAAKEGKPII